MLMLGKMISGQTNSIQPSNNKQDMDILDLETLKFQKKIIHNTNNNNNNNNQIDPRDIGTPDHWISRDSELIRLTGKHPFNSEPPLSKLMNEGFITPVNLHYVRNHGAVPKLTWDTHTLEISG